MELGNGPLITLISIQTMGVDIFSEPVIFTKKGKRARESATLSQNRKILP